MFSLLGGEWRGRKLKAIDRPGLRPSSSRVKASIFSILESIVWKRSGQPDFTGWRCADLFAGVGGLGLEILSRGAASCVFVEKDRVHAKVLQENIRSLGCEARCAVVIGEVERPSWETHGPFELILIDPPYASSELPTLLARIVERNLLSDEGIVLFEHDPGVTQGEVRGLRLHSTRTLGPAGISVYLRDA
jgi:16S rRNA (guanine966-N2)-methyltransferase